MRPCLLPSRVGSRPANAVAREPGSYLSTDNTQILLQENLIMNYSCVSGESTVAGVGNEETERLSDAYCFGLQSSTSRQVKCIN
jgi:hypothetical protein